VNKLTLRDLTLKGKRVIMRVDYNVPLNKDDSIADDTRIRATLPSIEYILQHGASLVLMSHMGRPKGVDPKLTLAPCAKRLSELLQKPVQFTADMDKISLKPGEVLLLENLRFHPAEEEPEKDPSFVGSLAKLGDVYVNDAFGTAHRAHASTALIAKYFPKKAAAGFLLEKEIEALAPLVHQPERPFYAIIGGAKVSTKIGLIQNLLKFVDGLFLGGAMIFTFLKAQGLEIGDSLFEAEQLQTANDILKNSRKLHFPTDIVIADSFSNDARRKTIPSSEGIPKGWQGLDIGAKTIEEWSGPLSKAATVFWNGPVGVFEMPHFATGTMGIAKILASSQSAKVIVGGGDSVAAIEQTGLASRFFHLSTGGGAAIEYLEFGHLPGIDSLSEKK
jgi:phosphoglycerate kinase